MPQSIEEITQRVQKDGEFIPHLNNEIKKIIAKDIIPLSEAAENWTGKIHVNIQTAGLETDFLEKIKSILEAHRGKNDVLLHLISPDGKSISMNASTIQQSSPKIGRAHV